MQASAGSSGVTMKDYNNFLELILRVIAAMENKLPLSRMIGLSFIVSMPIIFWKLLMQIAECAAIPHGDS